MDDAPGGAIGAGGRSGGTPSDAVPARPDPAAPQERTSLAWRRTGLALLIATLTIGRLTLDTLGPAVVAPTVLGAVLAGWVALAALRTRRPTRADPGEPTFSVLADGRLPAVVAAVVAGLALGELLAALVGLP